MAIQFLNTVAVDTDVLYVDTSSNRVGIGEPNPDYELHVDGQIYSESSTFPVYFLQRETSITGDGTFTTTGGIASGFHLRTNSSGTIQNGFGGGIVFSLTDSGTASNTAARIYARRDGGNTTGALQFWGGFNGNSPLMTMRASGNVGIGTANPINGKLQIDSTGNQISIETGTSGDGRLQIGHFSNGTFIGTYGDDGGAADIIRFGTHSGDERMRIDSSGRVGIGTSSPSSYLEIETSGSSGSDDIAIFSRSTGEVLKISREASEAVLNASSNLTLSADYDNNNTGSGSNLIFKTDASERMRINSAGNVGIGTTNPSGNKFQVNQTSDQQGIALSASFRGSSKVEWEMSGANNEGHTFLHDNGTNRYSMWYSSRSRQSFLTENSERMRIDSSGNVLINRTGTSGLGKLNVEGGADFTGGNVLLCRDTGAVGIGTSSPSSLLEVFDSNGIGLRFGDVASTPSSQTAGYIGMSTSAYSGNNGDLVLIPRTSSASNILLMEGNVGIGATVPLRKLHVAGGNGFAVNASTTQYYGVYIPALGEGADPQIQIGDWHNAGSTIKWDSSARSLNLDTQYSTSAGTFNITGNDGASTFLTILPSGNVGIGTTSPDALLDIGVNNIITLDDTGSSTGFIGMGSYNDGTKNRAQGTSYYGFGLEIDRPNQNISFNSYDSNGALTAGTNILVLKRTGNVGIGTTSPAGKLEINGGTGVATSGGTLIVRQDGDTLADGIALTSSNAISHRMFKNSVGTFFMGPSSNAEAFALDLNGNVGIGTTSPSSPLTFGKSVYGNFDSENFYRIKLQDQGGTLNDVGIGQTASGSMGFNITNGAAFIFNNGTSGEIARFNGTGLGIGTTSPSAKLDVNGQGNFSDYLNVDSSAGIKSTGWVHLHRYGFNKNVAVGNNGTDVDLYVPNGSVGIGTSNPSARLSVENTTSTSSSEIVRLKSLTVSNGPFIRVVDFVRSNNSTRGYIAMNPYSVQYNSTSDYRLKRNVTPMENSIDRIKLLKPSRFNWVEGPDDYVVDGFIAHEVQDVVHDAVSGEKDAVDKNNEPAYQGIDQSKLVPLLTAALQDAITKIENLETRIQILENN